MRPQPLFCPLQAIVAAYGFDERTVASWQQKAGQHCEQVHHALVTTASMDLGQVQADEVRVRLQRRCVLWRAMAICIPARLCPSGYAWWTPAREASRPHTVT